MNAQSVNVVIKAINYVEDHLNEKIDLDGVSKNIHYSKYYLHRLFLKISGMTIHEYAIRRQLTEAAKLLVFSNMKILNIALNSGYESQQAFSSIFKKMYKKTPAHYRKNRKFYPLQLRITLNKVPINFEFTMNSIKYASYSDIDEWMKLVSSTIDGYPCFCFEQYIKKFNEYVNNKEALILKDGKMAVGIMAFNRKSGNIDFWSIHPQYRCIEVENLFIYKLWDVLGEIDLCITTFRCGDRADTGYRENLFTLGFMERELLIEFGYPTQKFVLPSCIRRKQVYGET